MTDLKLDPNIVEEQVRKLEQQAAFFGPLGTFLGFVAGAAIGGLPLLSNGPIPHRYGIASVLLGGLLAGVLGYMVGSSRAFAFRLRGQQLLGQLRLQQNVEALLAVNERPAQVVVLSEPEPVLETEPEPEPEAEAVEEPVEEPAPLTVAELAPIYSWTTTEAQVEPEVEPEPEQPVAEHTFEPEPSPVAAQMPEPEPEPVFEPEPVSETEAEPEFEPEPTFAPASWAAAIEELAAEPEHEPQHEPAPTWSRPASEEPVPAAAAWALPQVAAEPEHEFEPEPEVSRPAFGVTTPAWALPAAVYEPVAEHAQAPQPEPEPEPAAAPVHDLSTLSIAEIARLADAGSL